MLGLTSEDLVRRTACLVVSGMLENDVTSTLSVQFTRSDTP